MVILPQAIPGSVLVFLVICVTSLSTDTDLGTKLWGLTDGLSLTDTDLGTKFYLDGLSMTDTKF